MTGEEFKAAREALGLTCNELGVILGGIAAHTIRQKWQNDNPPPSPMAVQVVRWMHKGFDPRRLLADTGAVQKYEETVCEAALRIVERETGFDRAQLSSQRIVEVLRAYGRP